jgi:predicted acyl esterase
MGLNKWQSAETWPPKSAELVTLYLSSKGNANSVFGDGAITSNKPGPEDNPDAFTYDPEYPVPMLGGGFCCLGSAYKPGSFDQWQREARNDILVYSTGPLKEVRQSSVYAIEKAMTKKYLWKKVKSTSSLSVQCQQATILHQVTAFA